MGSLESEEQMSEEDFLVENNLIQIDNEDETESVSKYISVTFNELLDEMNQLFALDSFIKPVLEKAKAKKADKDFMFMCISGFSIVVLFLAMFLMY